MSSNTPVGRKTIVIGNADTSLACSTSKSVVIILRYIFGTRYHDDGGWGEGGGV